LSTLVSSKVNQWTLLVGTLPLVFAVAAGTATGLPVGPAQREELLLTAAQSLFGVAVLVNLTLSIREAVALSSLFLVQFALAALVPGAAELVALSVVYLVLAVVLLVRARHRLGRLVRDGLRTPYHQLTAQPEQTPPRGDQRPAGQERGQGPPEPGV
jgi:cation:H+ antiporter